MLHKPFSQACENNKQPILEVIRRHLKSGDRVLEIGSGTGQHAVFFAQQLPEIFWQTSDLSENHAGINSWIADSALNNIGRPLNLDVTSANWPTGYDRVFSANTVHIMPWQSVPYLVAEVAKLLPEGGLFFLYGPFNYDGKYTSDSNARFDQWLKSQHAHQGIRDFESVNELAEKKNLKLLEDNAMPANNRLLVWRKETGQHG